LIETLWRYLYSALICALALLLLHQHWQILVAPVPLDLYEGTALLITGIIAEGHNPYTLEFQPYAAYVYPPFYNMLVAPLTAFFGNTFQLHRAVSAVFILVAVFLVGLATWGKSGSKQQALAAGAMVYAALLFYATPVSSTNAAGVAIFLAGVIVPWLLRFSNGSLFAALVCGLLAFYTKQYFILGMAILCLYLFLYVSMARALSLGFLYAGLLLGSLAVVHQNSPYYLDNTLFAPSAAISGLKTWQILLVQLRMFVHTYAGLLVLMLIVGLSLAMRTGFSATAYRWGGLLQLARKGWRGPLLARPVDYFWFCLFWSTLVIVLWLGRNPGNYMTYLFQLMSPFLLILGFSLFAGLSGKSRVFAPLVLLSFYQSYAILHKDFSADMQSWKKIEQLIAESDEVLATQMLVSTLLQHDKEVYQDGHTFYFPLAANKPDWFLKDRDEDRVASIWRAYMTELYRKIERQEFDLVLVSPWEMRGIFLRNPPPFEDVQGKKFLSRHYEFDEKIRLSMTDRHGGGTYEIFIWRPKMKPHLGK